MTGHYSLVPMDFQSEIQVSWCLAMRNQVGWEVSGIHLPIKDSLCRSSLTQDGVSTNTINFIISCLPLVNWTILKTEMMWLPSVVCSPMGHPIRKKYFWDKVSELMVWIMDRAFTEYMLEPLRKIL